VSLTKTEYLYGIGVDTSKWATMLYADVLNLKISLAYNRITHLYKNPWHERDSQNVNECVAAMRHNEKLLKELK